MGSNFIGLLFDPRPLPNMESRNVTRSRLIEQYLMMKENTENYSKTRPRIFILMISVGIKVVSMPRK